MRQTISSPKSPAAVDLQVAEPRLVGIAEAAKRFGVTFRTLRFYEEHGLVLPSRGHRGGRVYDAKGMARLSFVFEARHCGFTVAEIAEALKRTKKGETPRFSRSKMTTQRKFLLRQREAIDQRLATLDDFEEKHFRGETKGN